MSNKPRHRPPRQYDTAPSYTLVSVGTGQCANPTCNCVPTFEPWSYTVGRSRRRRAELVTTGLFNVAVIQDLTDRVAHQIDRHDALRQLGADRTCWLGERLVRLDPVPDEWVVHDPCRIAAWFDRFARSGTPIEPPELLQIVWPDDAGRFPDDPACDALIRGRQALLGHDPLTYPAVAADDLDGVA